MNSLKTIFTAVLFATATSAATGVQPSTKDECNQNTVLGISRSVVAGVLANLDKGLLENPEIFCNVTAKKTGEVLYSCVDDTRKTHTGATEILGDTGELKIRFQRALVGNAYIISTNTVAKLCRYGQQEVS